MARKFDVSYLNDAADNIDASLFSSDDFVYKMNRDALMWYVKRWTKKLEEMEREDIDE